MYNIRPKRSAHKIYFLMKGWILNGNQLKYCLTPKIYFLVTKIFDIFRKINHTQRHNTIGLIERLNSVHSFRPKNICLCNFLDKQHGGGGPTASVLRRTSPVISVEFLVVDLYHLYQTNDRNAVCHNATLLFALIYGRPIIFNIKTAEGLISIENVENPVDVEIEMY